MDVIIEGKITEEEPMAEVIETLMELKNYPHLVLRVSQANADLEGRIAFSHGGYILGGRINNSDDTGYKAIHRLLSVKEGNYAILDPGKQQIADINQTLWIISEKVKGLLPNLPDTPVDLFDTSKERRTDSAESLGAGAAVLSGLGYGRFEQKPVEEVKKATITNVRGKARSFNENFWYFLQLVCGVVFCLAVGTVFAVIWQIHVETQNATPVKHTVDAKKAANTGRAPDSTGSKSSRVRSN